MTTTGAFRMTTGGAFKMATGRVYIDNEKGNTMYFVYLLTNKTNGVLYTGITSDLERRLYEHRNQLVDGFTKRYHLHKLVYYDCTTDVRSAIAREKQIKGWTREKKISLIESINPNWEDLSQNF